jgi:hypothetical protein
MKQEAEKWRSREAAQWRSREAKNYKSREAGKSRKAKSKEAEKQRSRETEIQKKNVQNGKKQFQKKKSLFIHPKYGHDMINPWPTASKGRWVPRPISET